MKSDKIRIVEFFHSTNGQVTHRNYFHDDLPEISFTIRYPDIYPLRKGEYEWELWAGDTEMEQGAAFTLQMVESLIELLTFVQGEVLTKNQA